MWKKGDTADADKLPAFSLPVRPSAVLSHTSLIKPAPPRCGRLMSPYFWLRVATVSAAFASDRGGRARTSGGKRSCTTMVLDENHIVFF